MENIKVMNYKITCRDCVWYSKLNNPRSDEPSTHGCYHSRWVGYIVNLNYPPCGGITYSDRTKFQMSYDEEQIK